MDWADMLVFLTVLVAIALIGLSLYLYITRSRSLLRKWIQENRYDLVHAEYRYLRKGPFFWSSRNQPVYRVEVRDAAGNHRSGWLQCGGWFLGVLTDKVKVIWDD
jgi:hypothetical protein